MGNESTSSMLARLCSADKKSNHPIDLSRNNDESDSLVASIKAVPVPVNEEVNTMKNVLQAMLSNSSSKKLTKNS